jgi:hypothetical protein
MTVSVPNYDTFKTTATPISNKKPNAPWILGFRGVTMLCDMVNWWPPCESNTAPTDYESAALTKHELGGRNPLVLTSF